MCSELDRRMDSLTRIYFRLPTKTFKMPNPQHSVTPRKQNVCRVLCVHKESLGKPWLALLLQREIISWSLSRWQNSMREKKICSPLRKQSRNGPQFLTCFQDILVSGYLIFSSHLIVLKNNILPWVWAHRYLLWEEVVDGNLEKDPDWGSETQNLTAIDPFIIIFVAIWVFSNLTLGNASISAGGRVADFLIPQKRIQSLHGRYTARCSRNCGESR